MRHPSPLLLLVGALAGVALLGGARADAADSVASATGDSAGAASAAAGPASIEGVPMEIAQAIFQIETLRLPATTLSPYTKDESPAVRLRAALAIGRLRDKGAGATILGGMATDAEASVRGEVAFALGQTPDTGRVLLAWWKRERDPTVRAALAVALGKEGGPDAVGALVDALGGEGLTDPKGLDRLTAAAAEGLGRLGMRKVEGASTDAVARRLLDHIGLPIGHTRVRAAWALARLNLTTASPETIDRLVRGMTHDPDPAVRAFLVRAWAGVTTSPAAAGGRAQGLAVLVRDHAPGVRIAAARALAKGCVPEASGLLARLLHDTESGVRLEAVAAVGACPGTEALALLRTSLEGDDPRLRAAAVAALHAAKALPSSIDVWLAADQPLVVRVAAVHTLSDRSALRELALRAPEPSIRSAAAESLLEPEPHAAADLTALLGAADPLIATAAADTLRTSPDAALERALVARLAKGDLDQASSATFARALAALYNTGKVANPAPEAPRLLQSWLGMPGLRDDAERLAAILHVTAPPPGHLSRRVPALADVLPIRSARIFTAEGEIRVALDPVAAPYTVWNFAMLAERGYFDGVSFHRVVPDFVVQAGDPRGDGWGGPGWEIPDEINDLPYETGALGMALSGPDTGGSQWFITTSPQPHLEGTYTVFGHVTYGQRNAAAIDQGEVIRTIRIERLPVGG